MNGQVIKINGKFNCQGVTLGAQEVGTERKHLSKQRITGFCSDRQMCVRNSQ